MHQNSLILFSVILCFGIGVALQKHGIFSSVVNQSQRTRLSFVRGFLHPVWAAGFGIGLLGWVLYFQAVSRMDISFVQPMINFSVLITLFISIVFLHEKLSRREWEGVAVIFIGGLFLLQGGETSSAGKIHEKRMFFFLFASGIVSLLTAALYVRARALVLKEILSSLLSGFLKGMAAVLVKATTVIVEQNTHQYNVFSLSTWVSQLLNPLFWLMFATNAAGYAVMQYAFSFGRASVIVPVEGIASFFLPVIAGIFVFSETLSFLRSAGIVIITCGILILMRSAKKV